MLPEGRTLGPNPPLPRRKYETTDPSGDVSTSHHRKGGGEWEEELRTDSHGRIFGSRGWIQMGNGVGRVCVCILPTFSQKRIFEDWILYIDCWFIKFDQWPLSAVPDQMIAMVRDSGTSENPMGRDSWDLIFRKLSNRKRGSYRKTIKNDPFVAINKKWIRALSSIMFNGRNLDH